MPKIAFLGAGNMAGALIKGLLAKGVPPSSIRVASPSGGVPAGQAGAGLQSFTSNKEAVKDADIVVIAVKPWLVRDAMKDFYVAGVLRKGALVVSVASGVMIDKLEVRWDGSRVHPSFGWSLYVWLSAACFISPLPLPTEFR